ncbi:MAG: AsmA family protein [Hyphomicrobiaceae bacterium]
MNSLVMWVGGLLAALFAALFAVPMFIDWNGYRGVFEEEVSRILGRDVRVGGDVNLRLLPTPYLRFEKVRVADVRPGSGNPLFRAESLTVWLSVPPLLQGNIEVRHAALKQPQAYLALDGDGRGTWTGLSLRTIDLPFVPGQVALNGVEIEDGTLVLEHASGSELFRLDSLSGELSAETLEGPLRFAGEALAWGARRELRLATARRDPDGAIRFKATARAKDADKDAAGTSATLEGRVTGFDGAVAVDGALALSVPLPALPPAARQPDATGPGTAPANGRVTLEIKAKLDADARRFALDDVQASIENVGQPQLITGKLTHVLGKIGKLDLTLSSRWLDFDRLTGVGAHASPTASLRTLADAVLASLPPRAETSARLDVDLVTLGGEGVGNVAVRLARPPGGPLTLPVASASLPAGGRVVVSGTIGEATGATAPVAPRSRLDAQVTASGPSLKRLMHWIAADLDRFMPGSDGAFSFDARAEIGDDRLRLTDTRATFAGATITGSFGLPFVEGGQVDVNLDADRLDWSWLSSGKLDRNGVETWLERLAGKGSMPRAGGTAAEAQGRQLSLKLTARSLTAAELMLEDVAANVSVGAGRTDVARLAFNLGAAAGAEFSGSIVDSKGAGRGHFDGLVRAASSTDIDRLLSLLNVSVDARRAEVLALAPLRLAGRVERGGANAGVTVTLDGAAAGGRLALRAGLARGFDAWRDGNVEVTVSGEDLPASRLAALLTGAAASSAPRTATDGGGILASAALKAVGVPSRGMVADFGITGRGLTLSYNGRALAGEDGGLSLDGTAEVAADRLGDVLVALGTKARTDTLAHAVTGAVGVATAPGGALKLTPQGLTVAGVRLDGELVVSEAKDTRLAIAGRLSADRVSIPGLVAGLTGGTPATAADAADPAAPLWTDQPFVGEAFDRFEGTVAIETPRLALGPNVAVSAARLALDFAPGKVVGRLESGRALGGAAKGIATFVRAPAGVGLDASLDIAGLDLAQLARSIGASRAAIGSGDASLKVTGRALSPSALVAALRGGGAVQLKDAAVEGYATEAVQQTVAAALAKQIELTPQALSRALTERLGANLTMFGSRRVGLEVIDSALRIERTGVDLATGRVEVLSTVDLASLRGETEWRLAARGESEKRATWPVVSILYVGPAGDVSGVEPQVALGGLERELTVRRMEREVEELERLRREDQERARQERERQRLLAEERLRLQRERQEAIEAMRRLERQGGAAAQGQRPPASGPQARPDAAGETAQPPVVPVPLPVPPPVARPQSGNGQPASPPASGPADLTDGPAPGGAAPRASVIRRAYPAPARAKPARPSSAGDTTIRSLNPYQY